MERLRQALSTLRNETDKALTRRKGAEYRSRELKARLQDKDEEVASLRERISLIRRLLHLTHDWDTTQRELFDNNERIRLANFKAEQLNEKLQRAENESDFWETRYKDVEANHRKLQEDLDGLL